MTKPCTIILGGSFNPPHQGHMELAQELRAAFQQAKIYLMPNAAPPHKHSIDFASRVAMLEIYQQQVGGFEILDIEQDSSKVHYTYETIQLLQEQRFKDHKIIFAMGSDSFMALPSWYKYNELLDLCDFVIYQRLEESSNAKSQQDLLATAKLQPQLNTLLQEHGSHLHFLSASIIAISSSTLRQRCHDLSYSADNYARYFKPYLHQQVYDYIYEHAMY